MSARVVVGQLAETDFSTSTFGGSKSVNSGRAALQAKARRVRHSVVEVAARSVARRVPRLRPPLVWHACRAATEERARCKGFVPIRSDYWFVAPDGLIGSMEALCPPFSSHFLQTNSRYNLAGQATERSRRSPPPLECRGVCEYTVLTKVVCRSAVGWASSLEVV